MKKYNFMLSSKLVKNILIYYSPYASSELRYFSTLNFKACTFAKALNFENLNIKSEEIS